MIEEEMFSDSEIEHAGYLVKQGSYWRTWKRVSDGLVVEVQPGLTRLSVALFHFAQ